jgi:hypothetical protein
MILPSSTRQQLSAIASKLKYVNLVSLVYITTTNVTGIQQTGNVSVSIISTYGNLTIQQVDIDTLEHSTVLLTSSNYTLSHRPYFMKAVELGRPIWSDPVISTIRTVSYPFVLVFAAPLFNVSTDGQPAVILGTLDFDYINILLRGTERANNTRVFITDRNGFIAGSSIGESLRYQNITPVLIKPSEHSDPVLRRTDSEILDKFGEYGNIPVGVYVTLSYGRGRNKRRVAIRSISDEYGLFYYVISVQKESDIMEPVYKSNIICAIVCSACILVALFIAICAGCIITGPLKKITRKLRRLSTMEIALDEPSAKAMLFEIDEMAQAMNRMQLGLNNFGKYIPMEVVIHLMKRNSRVVLGVVPREITTLFTDIKVRFKFITIASVLTEY